MKTKHLAISALSLAVLCTAAAAQDVDGSADHPLIGRFAGSVINAYDYREFDEYDFAAQPITSTTAKDFNPSRVSRRGLLTHLPAIIRLPK